MKYEMIKIKSITYKYVYRHGTFIISQQRLKYQNGCKKTLQSESANQKESRRKQVLAWEGCAAFHVVCMMYIGIVTEFIGKGLRLVG